MTPFFAALRALDAARSAAVDTFAALDLLRRAWDALPALLELADEWVGAGEDRCDCCGGTVDEDADAPIDRWHTIPAEGLHVLLEQAAHHARNGAGEQEAAATVMADLEWQVAVRDVEAGES